MNHNIPTRYRSPITTNPLMLEFTHKENIPRDPCELFPKGMGQITCDQWAPEGSDIYTKRMNKINNTSGENARAIYEKVKACAMQASIGRCVSASIRSGGNPIKKQELREKQQNGARDIANAAAERINELRSDIKSKAM